MFNFLKRKKKIPEEVLHEYEDFKLSQTMPMICAGCEDEMYPMGEYVMGDLVGGYFYCEMCLLAFNDYL